jgi:hypothetical protein
LQHFECDADVEDVLGQATAAEEAAGKASFARLLTYPRRALTYQPVGQPSGPEAK